MKKKLFFLFSIILFSTAFISCSSDDTNEIENLIDFQELPMIAQTFLNNYFGGKDNVEKINKDIEKDIILYEVYLKDNFEIVFNHSGYWQEVDAPSGKTIPTGFLPQPIVQTLNNQFHGYGIVEVNTTGENYHLVLSNNQGGDSIGMIFNQSGEIISYDNDPV